MLTREHRKLIAARIPPGVQPSGEFWDKLATTIEVYCAQQARRTKRPPARERQRWQRIEKLVAALGAELRELKRTIPASGSDPLWPNRALAELLKVKQRAETAVIAYSSMGASAYFGARRNLYRKHLYDAVLDLWQYDLGQELRISTSSLGKPIRTGPLIRFFRACVTPALGSEVPSTEAIAKIVSRRKRQGALTRKK